MEELKRTTINFGANGRQKIYDGAYLPNGVILVVNHEGLFLVV